MDIWKSTQILKSLIWLVNHSGLSRKLVYKMNHTCTLVCLNMVGLLVYSHVNAQLEDDMNKHLGAIERLHEGFGLHNTLCMEVEV